LLDILEPALAPSQRGKPSHQLPKVKLSPSGENSGQR
jgi:hypothetical protein